MKTLLIVCNLCRAEIRDNGKTWCIVFEGPGATLSGKLRLTQDMQASDFHVCQSCLRQVAMHAIALGHACNPEEEDLVCSTCAAPYRGGQVLTAKPGFPCLKCWQQVRSEIPGHRRGGMLEPASLHLGPLTPQKDPPQEGTPLEPPLQGYR